MACVIITRRSSMCHPRVAIKYVETVWRLRSFLTNLAAPLCTFVIGSFFYIRFALSEGSCDHT